jgi:8-oxo-dGTP pyrophosphatase MutT (NUDIX family)
MKERVRAIIKEGENTLLIHRIKNGREYWVFPGGGVEKTDADHKSALIRECNEELGVDVNVGKLFATYKFGEGEKEQCEYFYFCEITGGELGTGSGLEFQEGTHYEGMYALEWIPLEDFSSKNIQPEEVKDELQKEV